MDKVELQKSINDLKQINDETEEVLKKAGIDLNDLPSNYQEMIDEYIRITEITGVNNLSSSTSIEEWYGINKFQSIALDTTLFQLTSDVAKLENDIADEEEEIRKIQDLINTGKNTMSAEEFESEITMLKENIQQLLHKKNSMKKSPDGLDLGELIAAVEQIELKQEK